MKSNRPADNSSSTLLSNEENETVFKLLGPRCSTLATTVVQLLKTEAPTHDRWFRRHTGVLCFVKDGSKRSYYFRLYCPQKKIMIWEHEIYNEIKYIGARTFFHTFEGEDAMIGFSFANEEEANKLIAAVHSKLESRQRRREERKARMSSGKAPSNDNAIEYRQRQTIADPVPNGFNYKPQVMQLSESSLRNKNKTPRGKFRKEDIGQPLDFRHVFHVGPDAQDRVDETLKEFFNKVGISETHLRDQKTRTFIYDFINDHGGMDAVKHEVQTIPAQQPLRPPPIPSRTTPVNRRTPPPPPSRVAASGANSHQQQQQSQQSQQQQSHQQQMPPVTSRPAHSPAPPRPAVQPPRPQQAPPPAAVSAPPPPPLPAVQPQAAPPPPPPPPMDGLLNSAPRPLENASNSAQEPVKTTPAVPDMRSALMDSIRNAPTLRKVQPERKISNTDSRSNLLSEIRGGVELKAVPASAAPKPEERTMDGLAGALARALMARQTAINPDTDSSESESITDEEDWN